MLKINGKEYEIRYNIKRIEMLENTIGKSIMSVFVNQRGMMGLTDLKSFVAFGLKEAVDGSGYLSAQHGSNLAEQLLEEVGYIALTSEVTTAIERDCPFLFLAD